MATSPPGERTNELIAIATGLANHSLRSFAPKPKRRLQWQTPALVALALVAAGVVVGAVLRSRSSLDGTIIGPAAAVTTQPITIPSDLLADTPGLTTPTVASAGPAGATTIASTVAAKVPTGPIKPFRFVLDADGRGRMTGGLPNEEVATMIKAAGVAILGTDAEIDANYVIDPRVELTDDLLHSAVLTKELRFASGLAGLSNRHETALNQVIFVLSQHPGLRVVVEGHSDSIGNDNENLSLSQSRANRVAEYLTSHGVPREQVLEVVGVGEADPRSDNDTEEGRADNRRVDVHFTTEEHHD